MRNYVIINGVNSNTIQGLAINILPPITKPMMRSQIEEIDGRDGDLITELGYSAYDKTMEIGLWGTYDIDAIIKYFTGEGTIVFSTEPDKYYYFKILNQIDYEKLLKFKKATVTFHCQPFKYPTSETPLEEAYEYVEATGTDLTLNNTEETIFNKFDLIGNTYQETTNGNQLVNINNFNDAHTTHTFQNDILTITAAGGNYNSVGQSILDLVKNNPGKTIKFGYESIDISGYTSTNNVICQISITNNGTNSWNTIAQKSGSSVILSGWTIPNDTSGITAARLGIYVNNANVDDNTSQIKITKPLLYFNNNDTYEPYTGGIPAPNPEYPQDIHVVSGDNTIDICGKNLYYTDSQTKTFTSNAGGWKYLDGTGGADYSSPDNTLYKAYVEYGKTYSFTCSITASASVSSALMYYDNTAIQTANGTDLTYNKTFTASKTGYILMRYYVNNGISVSISNVQLELGDQPTTYEPYKGASYPINLGVENLLEKINNVSSGTLEDGIYTSEAISSFTTVHFYPYNSISFNTGDTLYISADIKCSSNKTNTVNTLYCADSNGGFTTTKVTNPALTTEYQRYVFKTDPTDRAGTLNRITLQESALGGDTLTVRNIMVSKQMSNYFSPYGTVPIEMCSIPNTDYKDTFVHEDNKWYKYAMVGKQTFNGSEVSSWSSYEAGGGGYKRIWRTIPNSPTELSPRTMIISNYFKYNDNYATDNIGVGFISQAKLFVYPLQQDSKDNFMTWLGTHNTDLYYPLLNPTQTEITDETLKSQLDDIWENAISYKGQTNITQTNNDMPFILDVSALKDGSDHLIINNIGTAYSKPTIDIEGTGIVDIYLNDEQIFEIDMTNENEIIIDTEKMEAYTPDNTLANRLVTGDYSNFKLAPGENDLRFSGDLIKATVTRYIRWI